MADILSGIRTRYGTYGILGNHDLSDIVPGLTSIGVRMLINRGEAVFHHGAPLWIGGVDDPHRFRSDSLEDALHGAPPGTFILLLAHSPELIAEAAGAGVGLYLCGHTHGGQVRFPLLGMIHINARCERRYAAGRWTYGAMQGYTTSGLGVTDVPVRFLCKPEAVMITLRRGGEGPA